MPRKKLTEVGSDHREPAAQVEVTISIRRSPRNAIADERAMRSEACCRIPRVMRLMALAIKFQNMLDRGEVRDHADLARLGYVTRARITQIMNLLLLAPKIQEELLEISGHPAEKGKIPERELRAVTRLVMWDQQKLAWERLRARCDYRAA